MKDIYWLGDSKESLKAFPSEVQKGIGDALFFAQAGYKHPYSKPFKGIGSGVFEVVKPFKTDTYRAVYAVKIGEKIYVLHIFQKKSKKGISTPKNEIEIIKERYKLAKLKEEKK